MSAMSSLAPPSQVDAQRTTNDLFLALKAGNEDAHRAFDERMRPVLASFISSKIPGYMRSRFTTEDLVQTTLIEAWSSRDKYELNGPGAARAFLYRIIERKFLDYWRYHRRKKRSAAKDVSMDQTGVLASLELEDANLDPVAGAATAAELLEGISNLPAEEREVICLVEIQGMTAAEAAQTLGVSERTVNKRRSRAIARIDSMRG